jgi:hypothetical protein
MHLTPVGGSHPQYLVLTVPFNGGISLEIGVVVEVSQLAVFCGYELIGPQVAVS